ncbi:hypothetical protein ZWY2020_056236 [Hordeum vulgare]|nr:hypothetical protein ZWY2020_056236 [Hordeum vulgare]
MPATDPTPAALAAPALNMAPTESTVQAPSAPPTTPASDPNPAPLVHPTPTTSTPALPGLESSQWVDVMEIDEEPAVAIAPETPSSSGAAEAPNSQDEAEATLVSAPSWAQAIQAFLLRGELPQNKAEERQTQRRSASYAIINRELVRCSTTSVFQRYVESEEGQEILKDIHQGECGHHAASRTLVAKAFRHGFY